MLTMMKSLSERYTIPSGRHLCLYILRFLFGLCVAAVKAYSNDTRCFVWFVYGYYQELFEQYPVDGIGTWFVDVCKLSIDCFCA